MPFLVCCARYVHEDAIAHFLIKFTDLAIPLLVDLEKDAFEIREERGKTTPQEDEKEMLPWYDKTLALKTSLKTLPALPKEYSWGSSADADRWIKWAYLVSLLLKI